MAAVSRLLRLAPGERERYAAVAAGSDKTLETEILDAVRWEEHMGNFLKQPIARFPISDGCFAAGQVISERFEILRKIGEGGMGVVYEAFDRKRQQNIAVKCAKPGCADFLKPELQGALRVRHPNVCLVNEIHTAHINQESIDFLTMELLEGEPLTAWLAGQRELSSQQAIEIASQLCSGLAEAHRCAVIHRDLKPSNIILSVQPGGELRTVITDFGLAGESSEREDAWGTPAYMAPELWRGAKASKASDIYALGVLLHETFTAADKQPGQVESRSGQRTAYRKLAEDFLHIDLERRLVAFENASSLLDHTRKQRLADRMRSGPARRIWSKVVIGTTGLLCIAGGVAWWQQDRIRDHFSPLPEKRFVAILNESGWADARSAGFGSSVANGIESELVRSERSDHNLLAISTQGLDFANLEADTLSKLRTSLGANLALVLVSQSTERKAHIDLRLLDTGTGKLLRRRELDCQEQDCQALGTRASQTAAGMLDLSTEVLHEERLRPATSSLAASAALQSAEELRNRPNDSGLDLAIEQYKKAVEADPQYALAHAELARAYCRSYGMHGDAAVLRFARLNAERAMSLDDQLPEAHAALAFVFEISGNEQGAFEQIHRAVALDPANPRILLWEADIYLTFGKWADAERTYKRLEVERPNYWLPYQQLGALLSEQGKYEEAKDAFHSATLAAPWSAVAFDNLGMILLKQGRLAEAKDNFRKSLALNPTYYDAHLNLAEIFRDEEKYSLALSHLNEAIKINPSDDQSWLGLADCHEKTSPQGKEAQQAYARAAGEVQRILNTEPNNGSALIRLALYQAKTHSPARAAGLLQRAEQAGIDDIDSQLIKSRVLAVLKRREEAAETLRSCLRRGATLFEMRTTEDLRSLVQDSGTIE